MLTESLCRKCSLCDKPVWARTWCHTHYTRWWRHGDPMHVDKTHGKRPTNNRTTMANHPDFWDIVRASSIERNTA